MSSRCRGRTPLGAVHWPLSCTALSRKRVLGGKAPWCSETITAEWTPWKSLSVGSKATTSESKASVYMACPPPELPATLHR